MGFDRSNYALSHGSICRNMESLVPVLDIGFSSLLWRSRSIGSLHQCIVSSLVSLLSNPSQVLVGVYFGGVTHLLGSQGHIQSKLQSPPRPAVPQIVGAERATRSPKVLSHPMTQIGICPP